MLDYLKKFEDGNFHTYMFLPGEEEDQLEIQVSELKDIGEKISGSVLGDCYDVILFRETDDGDIDKLERFDAILGAPLEYMSMLIPLDFYGVICKKTTTSGRLMDGIFDKFQET
tara:strand:+ start:271 stop:612 length:342 start_codon:yes stop_codon:yes gene_type:complete